jgi:endonuclease/exonuclease/phosphatase family metal-dependent hydrolase
MKCLTWNLEWKTPVSKAGRLIVEQVASMNPDVVCYTEVVRALVPEGHSIESDPDYGYSNEGGRRKVILWSRHPWTDVDTVGDDEMPTGRFASGVTCGVRFVGVCIPWRDAHVNGGRRDRDPWEDHLAYCRGLGRVLAGYADQAMPTCVLGDYNQRIPRVGQPVNVAGALAEAIPGDFRVAIQGMKNCEGADLIDHFAVSPGLSISITRIVPRYTGDGTRLSDHPGVVASIELDQAGGARDAADRENQSWVSTPILLDSTSTQRVSTLMLDDSAVAQVARAGGA